MNSLSTQVELRNVTAAYSDTAVLRDVSLKIGPGELMAILGPSGCGKTTLLRVIAGLLQPTSGEVLFNGANSTDVPAEMRGAAVVFQKPLLFPYLTVAENVGFGLKMRKVPKPEIAQRVEEALQLVELEGVQHRRPSELSGGQEQRVSLARALVTRPKALLLDEPFSALDTGLRGRMRTLLKDLQKRLRLTTIFVTHDQLEAAFLADQIALLLDGGIEQIGSAESLYRSPSSAKSAEFLGWKLLDGEWHEGKVETALGVLSVSGNYTIDAKQNNCRLAFHPLHVHFAQPSSAHNGNSIPATIETVIPLGSRARFVVRLRSGELLQFEDDFDSTQLRKAEDHVRLAISARSIRIFQR